MQSGYSLIRKDNSYLRCCKSQVVWVIRNNLKIPRVITLLERIPRKMRHLHLWFCLIYGHRLPDCHFQYLALSKPGHPHRIKLIRWWRWAESNRRPEHIPYSRYTIIITLYHRNNTMSSSI